MWCIARTVVVFLLGASVAAAQETTTGRYSPAEQLVELYSQNAYLPEPKKTACVATIEKEVRNVAGDYDSAAVDSLNTVLFVDGCLDTYSRFARSRLYVPLPPRPVIVRRIDSSLYMRFESFDYGTAAALRREFETLERGWQRAVRRVVLDLRGNGGGRLDELREVLNIFFSPRRGIEFMRADVVPGSLWPASQRTTHDGLLSVYPIRILANRRCLSACEWMIATLRYEWYPAHTIVLGERTGGKGVIQCTRESVPFQAMLTCGEWRLPDGGKVHGVGIESDKSILVGHCDAEAACIVAQASR